MRRWWCVKLTTLAAKFLRIGATGFGGPMALISLMEQHLIKESGDLTPEDLADGIAIGQTLPGPVAVDCATHLGYRARGVLGATVSTVSLILPAFLLMLVLSPLYFEYGTVPEAKAFFRGVGPAVVAVILVAAWRLSRKFVVGVRAGVVAALACVGVVFRVNPVLIILGAGLVGLLAAPGKKPGSDGEVKAGEAK